MSLITFFPENRVICQKYRADIDGLRALAVLFVIIFHAFPEIVPGGFVGVDIFFVISGFLITGILLKELRDGRFRLASFYSRRINRIFPALILVLIASLVFGWFTLFPDEFMALGKHVSGGAGFIANVLYWDESGYFDVSSNVKPLIHLWSLGVEEQFYLFFPLLLWIIWKLKGDLGISSALKFLIALSFLISLLSLHFWPVAGFYLPFSRFWELLLGGLLAHVSTQKEPVIKKNHILAVIGLGLFFASAMLLDKTSPFPGYIAVFPVFATCMIIQNGPDGFCNSMLLSARPIVFIGLMSYPLYLWHWPLLSFAHIIYAGTPPAWIKLLAITSSFILAFFTYVFVERPIRFGIGARRIKALALAVLMCGTGLAGYYVYAQKGLPTRHNIVIYQAAMNEINRIGAIKNNPEGFRYTGATWEQIPYCKFHDAGGVETIAVIGDSHALAAYDGFAELSAKKGINTLLMAFSGMPSFFGLKDGRKMSPEIAHGLEIMENILKHPDITKVFIFTRGPIYLTGTDFDGVVSEDLHIIPEFFKNALQHTVDVLANAGKRVVIVSENPELPESPRAYVERPLRPVAKTFHLPVEIVKTRQAEYLKILSSIKHATVINNIDLFCPNGECHIFSADGALLYYDDDHLSKAGSLFQAGAILENLERNSSNASSRQPD